MLGAFRRSAVSHALRFSARAVSARPTPQRFQSLSSSISIPSYAPRSLFHSSSLLFNSQAAAETDVGDVGQDQVSSRFSELAEKNLVDPSIIRTLTEKMRIETMTDVQRETIPLSVRGDDVLAQAKTGTGKTIAFLIPVLQKLLNDPSVKRAQRGRGRFQRAPTDIRAIVISPTRELAEQIAVEASRLAQGSGIVVQTAVGGTQKRLKLQQVQREGCHILVATPGRLRDILSDEFSGVDAPNLSTLVLDEADRLLDDGFGPELMEIIQHWLPNPAEVPRQTLMFSATMAHEVMGMVRKTMKPDFSFVKTVRDDEAPTHIRVPQKVVLLEGFENILPALLQLAKRAYANRETSERPFKAIVYFNSTKEVNVAYETFDRLLNNPEDQRSGHPLGRMFIGEISSQLSQAARTRVADSFRRVKSGILFSSDVTARGMDFPDVTHVIQIGLPKKREDYIHRLGRTARANKTGEGWIFIHPAEKNAFRRTLHGIPVELDTSSLPVASLDLTMDLETVRTSRPDDYEIVQQINASITQIPSADRARAHQNKLLDCAATFDNKGLLPEAGDRLALHGLKLKSVPEISPALAQKLGLSKRDGFRIRDGGFGGRRDGGFGGRRDGGFGGRRDGGFGGRRDGGFGGRRDGGFGGRRDGDFGGRRDGGYGGRREGRAGRDQDSFRGYPSRERVDEWL
ncbi:P-loop containing nucleoside triphosphate hydrolase protein [Aspergillus pseudodeflectus]|uniref:ATP-dependent RNA helicase n=1 Tax=Aspergillus pseudodeflectus TaxID=176178 RepID=A0ABR4L0U7_9EURO